jgi:hypothetical protein
MWKMCKEGLNTYVVQCTSPLTNLNDLHTRIEAVQTRVIHATVTRGLEPLFEMMTADLLYTNTY